MRSIFAEWLDEMQHVADAENIIVQARHFDFLNFQFKSNQPPAAAYSEYKAFLLRWNAITENGSHTVACPVETPIWKQAIIHGGIALWFNLVFFLWIAFVAILPIGDFTRVLIYFIGPFLIGFLISSIKHSNYGIRKQI